MKSQYTIVLAICIVMLASAIAKPVFARNTEVSFSSFYNDNHRIRLEYSYDAPSNKNNVSLSRQTDVIKITLSTQNSNQITQTIQLQEGTHSLYWYSSQIGTIQNARLQINDLLIEPRHNSSTQNSQDMLHHTYFEYQFYVESDTLELTKGIAIPIASLEDMLVWKQDNNAYYHPEFMMFRWQSYSDVLVFSFESRKVQAKYLKRLAFFTEKTDTRGTIARLKDISHRQGWGAHDYRAEDLAEFFNLVKEYNRQRLEPIVLTPEEELLLDILLETGVIIVQDQLNNEEHAPIYAINKEAPYSAIVSYVRTDRPSLQRTLLFHELLHTIYFRDQLVRETVHKLWLSMTSYQQKIWKAFLKHNGYSPDYNYLVENELFAYLLQRPVSDLSWYVPSRILPEAKKIIDIDTAVSNFQGATSTFTTQEATEFTNTLISFAQQLTDYVWQHFRIQSGDVRYVRK